MDTVGMGLASALALTEAGVIGADVLGGGGEEDGGAGGSELTAGAAAVLDTGAGLDDAVLALKGTLLEATVAVSSGAGSEWLGSEHDTTAPDRIKKVTGDSRFVVGQLEHCGRDDRSWRIE